MVFSTVPVMFLLLCFNNNSNNQTVKTHISRSLGYYFLQVSKNSFYTYTIHLLTLENTHSTWYFKYLLIPL